MLRLSIRYKQFLHLIRCFSFRKLVNYAKLHISYWVSLSGRQVLSKRLPFFISVEPADFCNLHCPECPVGMRSDIKRPQKTMDAELFKKLIDELKSTLLHTIFYFQGEPLLSKTLPEMIRYAHEAKIYTSTSTNAQRLSDDMAERLIASGLDKLIVSIDGITQESYEKYRIGGSLQKAIESTKHLIELRKKMNSATPFVEIQCLLLSSNEDQIKGMKKLTKELGVDKLTFKTAQFYDFENGHSLMPSKEKHSRYKLTPNGKYALKKRIKNRCWRLWNGAVVNVEGNILPCCFDKDNQYSFGNIHDNSFSECWHSTKANSFREKLLKNRKQFEMCRNCTS